MKYRIRQIREAKMIAQPPRAMTLEELAAASGLSVGLLSAVERGQQTTTRTLERIAQALGVRVTDLMDERQPCEGSLEARSAKGATGAGRRGKDGGRGGNRAHTADDSSTQGGAGSDLGEDGRPGAQSRTGKGR